MMCWREPERSLGLFTAGVVAVAAGKKTFILNQTRVSLFYPTPGSGMAVSSHRNTIEAASTPRWPALVSTYDEDRFRYGHRRLSRCVENRGSMQIGRGQTMSAVSVGAVHRLPTNGIADKPHCHRSVRAAGGQRRRDKSLSMGVLYIWIGRISQKGDEPITPAKRVQGATSPLQWLACIRCRIEAPASGCSALEQSILPFAVMGQHPEAVFLSALATTCVDLILPFAAVRKSGAVRRPPQRVGAPVKKAFPPSA